MIYQLSFNLLKLFTLKNRSYLILPQGGTSLPIWKQLDIEKHNHLPAISIYMSYSTGLLLLEWEEHFPPTEIQPSDSHSSAKWCNTQYVWHYHTGVSPTVHATMFLHIEVTRIDLFCIEIFSIYQPYLPKWEKDISGSMMSTCNPFSW